MKFFVILILAFGLTVSADDPNLETSYSGALIDQDTPQDKAGDKYSSERCCDANQRNQRNLFSTVGNSTSSSGGNQGSQGNQ